MNPTLTPEALLTALHARYATKAFDPARKIPAGVWSALEQSLILSPSSFGMQPWKFIVVTNPAVKTQLQGHAWNQPQVGDCSHFVVIARPAKVGPADVNKIISATAVAKGIPESVLEGYKQMMLGFVSNPAFDAENWAAKQCYIALGFIMESAALLGVDACPMEGINPAAFDQVLNLPATGYHAQVAIALGYRSATDKYSTSSKVRYPASELVVHV